MDHLLLPNGVECFIIAPYETPTSEWYDGKGFMDFPDRMGWSVEDLSGEVQWGDDVPFGRKSKLPRKKKEIENFFQTWLYFGLAIDVLGIAGIKVTTEDFLRPTSIGEARIVSTGKLQSFLTRWSDMSRTDAKKQELWFKLKPIFDKVAFFLDRFCPPEKQQHPSDRRKPFKWPIRDEISTTMIALACALHEAAKNICDRVALESPHWLKARSAILDRRIESKWCLADAALMEDEFQIDGHYFLAASPSPGDKYMDQHPHCTRTRCHYEVDEAMYVTKHAQPPWHKTGCKTDITYGGQLGPERGQKNWVDAVCRIIDKNTVKTRTDVIPIAMWSKKTRSLWSVEYHLEQTSKRKPHYVAISHVWADGKGNPNDNSLPQCQIERIQHLAESIPYAGRKGTGDNDGDISFWMDTLCIPVQKENKDRRDIAIASMRDVYKNATCVLILDSWLEQIPSTANIPTMVTRLYQSNWIKRLWTHQEGFFPKQVFVQFSDRAVDLEEISTKCSTYNQEMAALGTYLEFASTADLLFAVQYTALKQFYLLAEGDGNSWMLYKPLSHIMGPRQTTRKADETVCLATILDYDVFPYLAIPAKPDDVGALERMKLFLKQVGRFESGIIFNNYYRLDAEGYRWAPKSLLGHNGGRSMGANDEQTSDFGWSEYDGHLGLTVQYPGFSKFNFSNVIGPMSRESISCAERAFAIVPDSSPSTYIIEVQKNEVQWTSSDSYCVILSKVPVDEERVFGVVGKCNAEVGKGDEVNTFDHLCLASVRIMTEYPSAIDSVSASLLGGDTKWLVR